MLSCPYCNHEITSEKFHYCPNCEKQVKCKSCDEPLLANKTRCLVCGTRLIDVEDEKILQNRYYFEENITPESSSRKIELSFSDSSIEKAIPLFSTTLPLPVVKTVDRNNGNLALPESARQEIEAAKDNTISRKDDEGKSIAPSFTQSDIFIRDEDGYLISQAPDYKGSSRKQQQERFCLLYVWGHLKEFGKGLEKVQIMEGARRNGLFDNNLRIYIKNIEQFLTKVNEIYRLNPAGQNRIAQILNEMQDESIKGFIYWEAPKPRAKRAVGSKEESKKAKEWLSQPSELENFDVRRLKTIEEICMFGLYDITKTMKVAVAVKPSTAFDYLIARYKTLALTKEQFSGALRRKENKGNFGRTAEGLYYLTEAGETAIRLLIDQSIPQ